MSPHEESSEMRTKTACSMLLIYHLCDCDVEQILVVNFIV